MAVDLGYLLDHGHCPSLQVDPVAPQPDQLTPAQPAVAGEQYQGAVPGCDCAGEANRISGERSRPAPFTFHVVCRMYRFSTAAPIIRANSRYALATVASLMLGSARSWSSHSTASVSSMS